MNIIISIVTFLIVLFIYLHIYYHIKKTPSLLTTKNMDFMTINLNNYHMQ